MNAALKSRIEGMAQDGMDAELIAEHLNQVELADEPIAVSAVEEVVTAVKSKRMAIPVDISNLKIEKGLPIPEHGGRRKSSEFREFMSKLEIGDSFAATEMIAKKASGTAKTLKFKISIRKIDDETMRVWRTA